MITKRIIGVFLILLLLAACTLNEQVVVPTLIVPSVESTPMDAVMPTLEVAELTVDRLEIQSLFVGARSEISVAIYGTLPSCMVIEKIVGTFVQERVDNIFFIQINPMILNEGCTQEPVAFQNYVGLEYEELPAGDYYVEVAGIVAMFVIEDQEEFTEIDGSNLELVLAAVKNYFASNLSIPAVEILGLTPVEWADGCLELPEGGEACTEAIVPGYLLKVGDGSQNWDVHINFDASILRLLEGEPSEDQNEVILVTVTQDEEEVNLRAGPGMVYEIVGTAPGGAQLIAIMQTTDGLWLKVIIFLRGALGSIYL